MSETRLLPIGAFARMARLTVKALRYYDTEGLLKPAEVDPSSGYRYYSLAQVPAASTIALLRSLDVSVARIGELLAASDDSTRGAVLDAERQRALEAAERHQRILSALDRLVESPAKTQYDVRIAARPAQRLDVLESATTADHLDVDTAAACQRLDALVTAARATAGPFVGIFPLDLEESFVLRVGVPTEQALEGTSPFDLPGGSWASTLHVGAYDLLPLAYSALLDHVHERGHEPGGVVCESYLTDPDTVAKEELVTALAMPLAS